MKAPPTFFTAAPAGALSLTADGDYRSKACSCGNDGEFAKAADYQLHARELNTARRHAQELPKLFLLSIGSPVRAKLMAITANEQSSS